MPLAEQEQVFDRLAQALELIVTAPVLPCSPDAMESTPLLSVNVQPQCAADTIKTSQNSASGFAREAAAIPRTLTGNSNRTRGENVPRRQEMKNCPACGGDTKCNLCRGSAATGAAFRAVYATRAGNASAVMQRGGFQPTKRIVRRVVATAVALIAVARGGAGRVSSAVSARAPASAGGVRGRGSSRHKPCAWCRSYGCIALSGSGVPGVSLKPTMPGVLPLFTYLGP